MKSKLELKKELYNQCSDFIEHRLLAIKSTINDIQESLDSETKSSAGDKHETGRAMLQLDREKLGQQLAEIQKLNEQRAPLAVELKKVESEVGPIKYVAALIYGDNPDANLLEKAVRWVRTTR